MKATETIITLNGEEKKVTAWWHHNPVTGQTTIVTVCDSAVDIYNRLPSTELEKIIDEVARDAARLTVEERERMAVGVFNRKTKNNVVKSC